MRLIYTKLILIFGIVLITGCSVKLGTTSFSNENVDNAKEDTPYEIELQFYKKWSSTFSISFTNQEFVFEPGVSLKDIDLTWRYHFKKLSVVKPFVGAGYGYYKLEAEEKIDTCPSGYICYGDWTETERSTIVSGSNPHLVIGLELPISTSNFSILLEDKYEISKESEGADLSSNTIFIGIKWSYQMMIKCVVHIWTR